MGNDVDGWLRLLIDSVSHLRSAFQGIAAVSKSADASGVEFAGYMLLEALDSFEAAVIRYTNTRKESR